MRRDLELFRKILLAIEDCPKPKAKSHELEAVLTPQGYTREAIGYHIKMLEEEGCLGTSKAGINYDDHEWTFTEISLKADGHVLCEKTRSDDKWKTAVAQVGESTLAGLGPAGLRVVGDWIAQHLSNFG